MTLSQIALASAVAWLAAIFDLRERRVPNLLTYPAIVGGLLLHVFHPDLSLTDSGVGLLIGFVPSLVLFQLNQIGGGDVKLLAGLGAIAGEGPILDILTYSIAAGLVMALVLMMAHGRSFEFFRSVLFLARFVPVARRVPGLPLREITVPFAVPVAVGTTAAFVMPLQDLAQRLAT